MIFIGRTFGAVPIIDKIAWIHLKDGAILSTRSAGKDAYYIPGGKREPGESDVDTLVREIREELGLDTTAITPIGNYIFERKNEVMLCYHAVATGDIRLGAELAEYRRYKPHELKPWPRATGFAVADWMTSRGLAFEYADFPGAASWLARADRQ